MKPLTKGELRYQLERSVVRIAELEAEVDRLKAQNADLRKTSISPENEESDG